MKFKADRKALHEGFQRSSSVVTSTIARPIYQNVKIEASGGRVLLSATDLEVGVRVVVDEVEIEEEGAVLLPHDRVASILRLTTDDHVSVVGDSEAAVIESSDSRFRVLSENPEDFSDITGLEDRPVVEVDPEVLVYMVRRTAFAAAAEKGRYALNGVFISIAEDGGIEMVAADGARLACVKKKTANPNKVVCECIIPRKGAEHLVHLAQASKDPVQLRVSENQLVAENEGGRLCCQLVEGQFPNYREVMPTKHEVKIEMSREPFLSAVDRAALMTSDRAQAVDFCFSKGLLTIKSEDPELGQGEVRLPIEFDGKDLQISFNPEFIRDMLRITERETVKFEFTDARTPCVIRSGVDFTYVVSPVIRDEAAI